MRRVLLHRHIFKNGGQTLERMLQLSFGDRFLKSEVTHAELRRVLDKKPDIVAVSSHNLRPPSTWIGDIQQHDLVMLRDPWERLISIWRYLRLVEKTPSDMAALPIKAGLHEFLYAMLNKTPWHVYDHQVAFLSRQVNGWARPSSGELASIQRFLPLVDGLGVLDLWEESLRTAERRLCEFFPELVLFTLQRDNASAVEVLGRDQARKMVRDTCGWRFYQEIAQAVQGDSFLVQSAREEVWRRMPELSAITSLGRFAKPDWGFHFRTTCEKHILPFFKDKPCKMLEVGVFEGRGMCWAFEYLLTHGQSSYVGCDPWYWAGFSTEKRTWNDIERVAMANAALFAPRARLVKGNITDALRAAPGPYDFIYIDGDHSAESCLRDSEQAWQFLKPGGFLLWDDVGTTAQPTDWPGVAGGMSLFLTSIHGEYEIVQADYQVLIKKLSA